MQQILKHNSGYKYKLVDKMLESSPAERDLGQQ